MCKSIYSHRSILGRKPGYNDSTSRAVKVTGNGDSQQYSQSETRVTMALVGVIHGNEQWADAIVIEEIVKTATRAPSNSIQIKCKSKCFLIVFRYKIFVIESILLGVFVKSDISSWTILSKLLKRCLQIGLQEDDEKSELSAVLHSNCCQP